MRRRLLQWIFAEWQELEQVRYLLQQLKTNTERLIMKADEAVQLLNTANQHLTEIGAETDSLLTMVKTLQDAAANADLPQEVADAITAVANQAQVVDDKVPDAPPPA